MLSEKKPLIAIFGWLGAKPRHIAEIKSIYKGLPVETVAHVQKPLATLNIRSEKKVVDDIYRRSQGRPLLCHVFSLNGASALVKTFSENYKWRENVKFSGIIWDSTPCLPYPDTYRAAYSRAMFPHHKAMAKITESLLYLPFAAYQTLGRKHLKEFEQMLGMIENVPPLCPQLFLSSLKDDFVPTADVMYHADRIKEMGADVDMRVWDDSGHIRMFRDHPSEYNSLVLDFAMKTFNLGSNHSK